MGRACEREDDRRRRRTGGREDSGGRKQWFPLLGASATAREGVGDGGEHRLGCAVLKTSVTRLGTIGIGRISSFIPAEFTVFLARNFQVEPPEIGGIERRKWRDFERGSDADRLGRKTESERARLGVDFHFFLRGGAGSG
ncbi:hypothetical protein CRG98_038021 [Punica granatum]|uniref:Uncharacterized protein n=1 Tax=Punica granatum TaxID=22663 RepID=A0A2I0IC72_PUNGR|nr:hypothetical protein CRG98_038021 [Punica granatum]